MKTLLLIALFTISATAQAPALIKVGAPAVEQLRLIATEQQKLIQQFQALEQQKVIVKLRACLDAKLDSTACDALDLAPEGDGWVLKPRPVEKKP